MQLKEGTEVLKRYPKTGFLNKQESGGSSAESSYFLIEATFT